MAHIERNKYLDELVSLRHNGMIKVITGMRRCGKSYLLLRYSLHGLKMRALLQTIINKKWIWKTYKESEIEKSR